VPDNEHASGTGCLTYDSATMPTAAPVVILDLPVPGGFAIQSTYRSNSRYNSA
jgi:hypothetical protein